jgi:hypothetical protein
MYLSESISDAKARQTFKAVLVSWIALFVVTFALLALFLPSSAHAEHAEKDLHSNGIDTCLPLLHAAYETPIYAPARTSVENAVVPVAHRRDAGKVALLALALGMQNALGPVSGASDPQMKSHKNAPIDTPVGTDSVGKSVKHIVAYRACSKQKALETLQTMRWVR